MPFHFSLDDYLKDSKESLSLISYALRIWLIRIDTYLETQLPKFSRVSTTGLRPHRLEFLSKIFCNVSEAYDSRRWPLHRLRRSYVFENSSGILALTFLCSTGQNMWYTKLYTTQRRCCELMNRICAFDQSGNYNDLLSLGTRQRIIRPYIYIYVYII